MTRQSLKLHAAFAMLDSLTGKVGIEEITDHLIGIGYIKNDPEDYRRWQVEEARKTLRSHRKSKARGGDIQHELVNLYEVDEGGRKVHYYRPCGELSMHEAAQHIQTWREKVSEDQEQLSRYYKFHYKRHGKKLQRFLDFSAAGSTSTN